MGIDDSGISDCVIIIRVGEKRKSRRTGVVLVGIHNYVALEIKLRLVRQHLCTNDERDEFRADA